jgi:iron complex outermembrane recepter protein
MDSGHFQRAGRAAMLARAVAASLAAVAAAPAVAQQAGGSRGGASAGLDEIVVTARRVEERLVDVPIAITAFTADELARRNIQGIGDVAKFTAGFSFENYSGGSTPAPVIRGLSQTFLADRNQNVATFVDGVHVQQQGNVDFSLLELERIEVLKGPQNSQYGRSAFAGAINYVPKAPVLGEWDASVAATVGTDERLEGRVGISIPLWQDKLALRVYGVMSEFDGTWENKFPTGDSAVAATDTVIGRRWQGTDGNVGGFDHEGYRAALTFRPIESLTIDASWWDSELRYEFGATGQIRPGSTTLWGTPYQTNCSPNAAGTTLQLYCGELKVDENAIVIDPRSNGNYADSNLVTGRVEWKATDALTVTYIYGKGDYFTAQFNQTTIPPNPAREACGAFGTPCPPNTPGFVLFAVGSIQQNSESHEIKVDGRLGDALRWRVGYYTSKVDDDSYQNSSERRRSLVNDPTGQVIVLSAPLPLSQFRDDNDSVFASVAWQFGAGLTLDVEGRYTEETRLLVGSPIGETTFSTFTPRVNLKWQPDDASMYYGSVAKGAKAGGFNTILAPPGQETFDPETNLTYELGTKQTLLDGRLQLNAAVYFVDWEDLQVSTANLLAPPPGATSRPNYTSNAAGASSKGIEVELVGLLSDSWRFNFAGSYADPKYDNGTRDAGLGALCNSPQPVCPVVIVPRPPAPPAVVADIGGNTLARTPKTQLSAGLEYLVKLAEWDWSARADVSHQSKIYAESLNAAWFPARTLVDVNFGVTSPDKRWGVNLWGRNVTDEVYTANSFVIGFANFYNPSIGDGRTFGVTARFNY